MKKSIRFIILVLLTIQMGCSVKQQKSKSVVKTSILPMNYVGKVMLSPEGFINKKITVFGLLDITSNKLRLIPNEFFVGLETIYVVDNSLTISKKEMTDSDLEQLKNCRGQLIEIKGEVFKLKSQGYFILPEIINTSNSFEIGSGLQTSKMCFFKKNTGE